jgi:signal transduction histidine kinase
MDDAQFPLKREPLALESVVQGAVDARVATANSRGVAFATDLAHTRVAGDRDRLRQVIDNLLDNAVRHSPDNGTVTVTLTSAPDSPGVVTLSVADQGPGFPSDFLARAFDRFTRGDEARSDDEGTGLGLAIAASLAAAHDGTVSAANRPEGGAVVRVELPTL